MKKISLALLTIGIVFAFPLFSILATIALVIVGVIAFVLGAIGLTGSATIDYLDSKSNDEYVEDIIKKWNS